MPQLLITDAEFARVRSLAMKMAGISLPASKKTLVVSRWGKRLAFHHLESISDYLDLIGEERSAEELQISLDLLTTNETYFFREPKHFDFLRDEVFRKSKGADSIRVWSAACSTGEEPYSVAMQMAAELAHSNWEVVGSDISSRVLEAAQRGMFDSNRIEGIPPAYLQRFCLKGTGPYAGKLLVDKQLRARVRFERVNLNEPLPRLGLFDVILLRNVMIYFDMPTKARLIQRLIPCLKPGGYFLIGHCDSISGIPHPLELKQTAVYRKPLP
jgi:chemotaxis protein methyltransferase CheR